MKITTIQTGYTKVSPAVPDRSVRKSPIAYTGLFQKRKNRITVPVKCFYAEAAGHKFLIDAGWSKSLAEHPVKGLGPGLYFASEPVVKEEEAAAVQLKDSRIDDIFMTHLDCDHVSGLADFQGKRIWASKTELSFSGKKKLRYGKLMKGLDIQTFRFRRDPDAPFGRSCDVYGDGSVIAYLTPTHSAGSVIYRISEGNGYALVVGDNGYSETSWMEGRLPGPLYNKENMKQCLDWIRGCSEDPDCEGIFCAHDPVMRSCR